MAMQQSFGKKFVNFVTNPKTGWTTTHFWGPVLNWGLIGAAVLDAATKGPEIISLPMTGCMIIFSGCFMRFSWVVNPRNYILLACHSFNELAQLNQLRRGYMYQLERRKRTGQKLDLEPSVMLGALAVAAGAWWTGPMIQKSILASKTAPKPLTKMAKAVNGPFSALFWAPTMKWTLSISNLMDYKRPVEKVSLNQQVVLAVTCTVWCKYAFAVNPPNMNLFLVNAAVALTAYYHLGRKILANMDKKKKSQSLALVPVAPVAAAPAPKKTA